MYIAFPKLKKVKETKRATPLPELVGRLPNYSTHNKASNRRTDTQCITWAVWALAEQRGWLAHVSLTAHA